MRRSTSIPIALAFVGLASCAGDAEVSRPKNLVFLCVDTLRADHLGYEGRANGVDAEGRSLSPRIDELAASGVVFERAVSHASWTLPSFASLLTSTYSSTHGCWNTESRLVDSFTTLPEILQSAGFDTFGIGSHVFFNEHYGLQQGFDAFDDELARKRVDVGWVPLSSPVITKRAVDWLDARATAGDADPFLLFLHYFDPHLPYVDHSGAGRVDPASEHDRYKTEITYTDSHVGQVLDALERLGLADETCVVFVSDHGEAWQEHAGVRRHARSLFTEELRVPLIVRVPGVAPRRVTELVRTVDVMPTLLELFGLSDDVAREGASLVPVLRGAAPASNELLAEIRLHDDARHTRAFLSGKWKLIERKDGVFRLYDTDVDPGEERDLAQVLPDRVEALRASMEGVQRRAQARAADFAGERNLEVSAEDRERLNAIGYSADED